MRNLQILFVPRFQILAHFKPNSRQRVIDEILVADNALDRFRADSLRDSSPDNDPTTENPVVAACDLYDCGRNHLAEYLTGPIFEGNLLGSDDAQPGC